MVRAGLPVLLGSGLPDQLRPVLRRQRPPRRPRHGRRAPSALGLGAVRGEHIPLRAVRRHCPHLRRRAVRVHRRPPRPARGKFTLLTTRPLPILSSCLAHVLRKSYEAKATFYITGRNLGKGAINDASTPWPGLIRRMLDEGHQIASHTWSHQRLTQLSEAKFRNQMLYNEVALADLLGFFPTYMRPPYSASNSTTDAWLGELGYHITYFNLDTEGYLHDDPNLIQTSKDIWDTNVDGADPDSTKWLQIEHDPVYQTVYNLTDYVLQSLFDNGFQSVTVGECLNDPEENWYRNV